MVHKTLPSFSAYDPVGQSVQMAAPGSAANVPMGHSVRASDELDPALSRNEPSGTGLHSFKPSSSAYVPTGHGAHSAVPGADA